MAHPSERGLEPRHARRLFVALPVRELTRSMRFFARLGFAHDPKFTDEMAACMIISDVAFLMLLTRPFFQTFSRKAACDTSTHIEGVFALSCRSRAEVDGLLAAALAAGATPAGEALDHGFTYAAGFHDLDGHHWQLSWTAPHTVHA